jgi:hypothetical protein
VRSITSSGEVIAPDLPLPDCLDPGIRSIVMRLREYGVETFESCQGGAGHAMLEPTVRFFGGQAEGPRAFASAHMLGMHVRELRRYWVVLDGELVGPQWELTFELTAEDHENKPLT